MKLIFAEQAWEDYLHWQQTDKAVARRIHDLIKDTTRSPFAGIGKPEPLSFEQAAALPVNYLTAYALLAVMGSLQPGEAVLIHNAGGGVGLAALDIAKPKNATRMTTNKHPHTSPSVCRIVLIIPQM